MVMNDPWKIIRPHRQDRMLPRNRQPVRKLREGQTFVIITQPELTFSVLMLTVRSLVRRGGHISITPERNHFGIVEITFDEDAEVIIATPQER